MEVDQSEVKVSITITLVGKEAREFLRRAEILQMSRSTLAKRLIGKALNV